MMCKLCVGVAAGPEHDVSKIHLKNKVLQDYSLHKKQLRENKKGVIVSCTMSSTFASIMDYMDPEIKISVKPNEKVDFQFTVKNDDNQHNVYLISAEMAHCRLNFIINENIKFPLTLTPNMKSDNAICVQFISSDIGQYEVPIIFIFQKNETDEKIVIIRDMIVYVEEIQTIQQKRDSPYTKEEVKADLLFNRANNIKYDDLFHIPRKHKHVYSCGLKISKKMRASFIGLIKRIKAIFKMRVTRDNYITFFHNLLWYEETVVRINVKKYNMSAVKLLRRGDYYMLYVPGLAEKRPSLMPGDLVFIKIHGNDTVMFEGTIFKTDDNWARIGDLNFRFNNYYKSEITFDVRFFLSRMIYEHKHQAIDSVFRNGQTTRVFPVENPEDPIVKQIMNYYNPLIKKNPEQRNVVEHVLAGSSGTAPYLLHGPPGTGKTVTIVECILQLVNDNPKNRILVCTDSNMAADHVGTLLVKYARFFKDNQLLLRANSKCREWKSLPECLIKYSNGSCPNSFKRISIAEFMSYKIVITTLSHAAKFAGELRTRRYERYITHLFIDEAAQASEPSCMIPTCGLLTEKGNLVLSGDPLQLGPVIISHDAKKKGLGLSLMERLYNTIPLYMDESHGSKYTVMLRNNFRSNPDILHISNELFYKGQLRALAKNDELSNKDILGEKPESRATIFHGVLSKEQKMGKSPSFFNDMELEIVKKYIKNLVMDHKVRQEDIGVVTPYMIQVYKIKNWLSSSGYSKIEVGTVEAYQGKEKRVIIISTVRANHQLLDHDARFQLGFLVDDKRFNVALTRAIAKTIIIGNPICLQRDVKWRKYIQRCRDLGTYHGFDAGQEDNTSKAVVDKLASLINDLKVSIKA